MCRRLSIRPMRALKGWKYIPSNRAVAGFLDEDQWPVQETGNIPDNDKRNSSWKSRYAHFTWICARSVPEVLLILAASANTHGMAIALC